MKESSIIKFTLIITSIIIMIVAAYVICVGIIGGAYFSFEAKDWEGFSNYFNGMLSPILAAIAAFVAFYSFSVQIRDTRRESSLNEQIDNYLDHIDLIKNMIEKRWKTIVEATGEDWEYKTLEFINHDQISHKNDNKYLVGEVVMLTNLFQDLSEAVQWYTHLHKEIIDLKNKQYPKNEWAHFSNSLIREHDKKMIFCYRYIVWIYRGNVSLPDNYEKYKKDLMICEQFYENLKEQGVLLFL